MDKAEDSIDHSTSPGQPAAETENGLLESYKPDKLIGERLDGRFLIEKNLTDSGADAGGIGVVYLAKDVKLMDKEVVVKILREEALAHEDIVRKFMHEQEALIRLDHPGIVRILDSGSLTDGNPFTVMEFIEGYSLRTLLRDKGRMPLETAAYIIESFTDALAAAHSKEILHRDVKPENIMLTPLKDGPDRVRLIDFGIAKVGMSKIAPGTEIRRLVGTIVYIAPEQLLGSLEITAGVDVFATAIVAYEMVTGRLPFQPKSIAEMFQLEKEGVKVMPSELRSDLPRSAENLILAGLEFDVDKRPQDIRIWGRALAKELRSDPKSSTNAFYAAANTEFANSLTEIRDIPDGGDFPTMTSHRALTAEPLPDARKSFLIPAIGVIVLLAIALPLGYFALRRTDPGTPPSPVTNVSSLAAEPEHGITYWLNVQKMRGNVKFEEPFKSSGQEIFESGYKFTMVFQADDDGYLYIFNEGPDKQGNIIYNWIYPTPNASSQVSKGKQIETSANTFDGGRGTEIMWMVWTKEKNPDIESVVAAAAKTTDGVIKDAPKVSLLRDFIEKNKSSVPVAVKDTARQLTVIKGKGDIVVYKIELEHR